MQKQKPVTMGNLRQKRRISNYPSRSQKPTWQITNGDFKICKKLMVFHVFLQNYGQSYTSTVM